MNLADFAMRLNTLRVDDTAIKWGQLASGTRVVVGVDTRGDKEPNDRVG